jgi:hypothetical protein
MLLYHNAMLSNTTASNVAVGQAALDANDEGFNNVAEDTLTDNTTADYNTAVGTY